MISTLCLYSFSCNDLLIYAFIKPSGNVMTSSNHIWAKNITSLQRKMKKLWERCCHCLIVLPVVHGYIIPSLLLLAMMCLCATQCEGGWGDGEGAAEGKPSGEIRALSLCVIQYHACVPMNGCQDIWVRSQGTSRGRARLWWGPGWRVGEKAWSCSHTHI